MGRGRTDGCTITSGTDAVVVADAVATVVAVAVGVAVAVAVTVTVAVTVGVAVGSKLAVVSSGFGSGDVTFCVPHAASARGEIIAALITERTTSLMGERPW